MSRPTHGAPLALRIAVRLLPREVRDEVLGDLIEAWHERRRTGSRPSRFVWAWKQPLAALSSRIAHTDESGERGASFTGPLTDVRIALRSLAKAPTFSTAVVVTLALAIGSNTAIFSVVDAVLLDPLGFPESDRLVSIAGSAPGSDMPEEFPLASEFYIQYREQADLLEDVGMFVAGEGTMRAVGRVEQIFMVQGVPSLFTTLGATPALGRLPRPDEPIGSVVVISHSMWRSWFGADPGVIGRSYEIVGGSRTIVGVMGPEFRFPDERTSVWIHATVGDMEDIRPGGFRFELVGRMADGADHETLAAQLNTLALRLPDRVGGSARYARIIERHRAVVRSLEDEIVGEASPSLRLLFATVAIVLLIACANVMNLLLVRGDGRRRELSVRRALGASRWSLVRLQMTEALVLAALGGASGWLLAWAGLPALLRAAPENVINLSSTRLDVRAFLYTLALATLAACMFGLVPAVRLSRPGPVGALRAGGSVSRLNHGLARSALVTLQTASALVLLVASGLLARSYWTLIQVDPGYEIDDIFSFQIAPDRRADASAYVRLHQALAERLAALPGVESVGLTAFLPLDEGAGSTNLATERMRQRGESPLVTLYTRVGGDYFETMGIELERGRLLGRNVQEGTANVVVSRYTADLLWPGEEAVGKRVLTSSDTTDWKTVVGVVENILADDLRKTDSEPMVYLPIVGATPDGWTYDSPVYVVRSARGTAISEDVREIVREIVPDAPMYRVYTMGELAERSMAALSFTMLILLLAAVLALILGVVGLYGVLSFVVSQRAPEIALRVAIGAEASRVRRMVVAQGVRITLVGVALGLVAALAVTRVLNSLLFGVGALDPATFMAMSVLMLTVALMASYVPATRASRLDPMQLLRFE